MMRIGFAALALLAAFPVFAQANGTAAAPAPQPYATQPAPQGQGYAPPAQTYAPPPQGYAPAQQGYAPAQPPPAPQPQRYPEAQSVSPSTAGTGSQQVVVNPPNQPAPPPPAPAPAVTVNPPATTSYAQSQPVVVEREVGRSPLETVAIDGAYGALAGALVGAGIALIDQGNNWGRDLTLGAGAGILVGAVVGGIEAYGQDRRVAMDGLGSPERDRMTAAPQRGAVVGLVAGRF